jgi:hypothetical protein
LARFAGFEPYIRPVTHHYFHAGYTRALYLANGDILLSGSATFDPKSPWKSRHEDRAELWVLKKNRSGPAVPLGENCSEGPAVSRRTMRIAWTRHSQASAFGSAPSLAFPVASTGKVQFNGNSMTLGGLTTNATPGANTYSGGTVIDAGRLQFNSGAVPASGLVTINSAGTLLATGAYASAGAWLTSGKTAVADFQCLLGSGAYRPEDWVNDPARRRKTTSPTK